MRAARAALVGANLVVAGAIFGTYGARIGAGWGTALGYGALALTAVALLPLWRRRRFTTLVLASAGSWSMLTGIFLVYASPRLPGGRWMTWWHEMTSVAFALAFLAHWARNNPRLLSLARRMAERRAVLLAFAAAWSALALFAGASVLARSTFIERDHDLWADLALGASALLALGALFAGRAAEAWRNPARGAVDASLLALMWLATLTGFALQYLSGPLRAQGGFWLATAWHVGLSGLLLALLFAHAAFNARPLASHAR